MGKESPSDPSLTQPGFSSNAGRAEVSLRLVNSLLGAQLLTPVSQESFPDSPEGATLIVFTFSYRTVFCVFKPVVQW